MYLVDTSAWIRHFSKSDVFDLRTICVPDERLICPPVYQEVLQGIKDEAVFRTIKWILDSGEMVEDPLVREVFVEAASLFRGARRQGITVRSSVDCIIAACAIRHDLVVLHHDRDYEQLAHVSALRERSV